MFLMLFILLIVIFLVALPNYSNILSNVLCKRLFKLSDSELDLRAQVKDLKCEQASISMADEFARYMKLQRKIDKCLQEIKSEGDPRQQNVAYVKLGVKIAIYVLHGITMLTLVLMYRSTPLLMMPPEWFTPFNKIVAMPTGEPGGIGIGCWIVVCNTVVYRAIRLSPLLSR
ncbi:guided entry of tail-anchored proteins factor 1 [Patella vulgata]|uniref:guided entry of tail-anchored proteins factor 1 n=1 Tax=Patella vulgata TaxID=6465 RepID=UPI00217FFFFB|nr:guided entry of tail-anchored proteins factor 1 [Patella vulgata]